MFILCIMKYSRLQIVALLLFFGLTLISSKKNKKVYSEIDCYNFAKGFVEDMYPGSSKLINGSINGTTPTETSEKLIENSTEIGLFKMFRNYKMFGNLFYQCIQKPRKFEHKNEKLIQNCHLGRRVDCYRVIKRMKGNLLPKNYNNVKYIQKDRPMVNAMSRDLLAFYEMTYQFLSKHPEFIEEFQNLPSNPFLLWRIKQEIGNISNQNSTASGNLNKSEKLQDFLFMGKAFSEEPSKKQKSKEKKQKEGKKHREKVPYPKEQFIKTFVQ